MSVKSASAIIFANMHDGLMGELTANRSMASLPFGGRYRMIDFALSSLVDAGVTRVGVVTKSNYHSLMDHIGNGKDWDLARKNDGLSILPPHRGGNETEALYHGRVQALYNVLYYIKGSNARYVLLMDCDHVANVNIDAAIESHIASKADFTVVCSDTKPYSGALKSYVSFKPDENGRAAAMRIDRGGEGYLMSMNIFVASKDILINLIEDAMSRMLINFERDILLANLDKLNINCFVHDGFVRRIYDLNSYRDANMELLSYENTAELFLGSRPILTRVRDEAPVRYGLDSDIKNCLIADGCIVEGSAENCVLFRGVTIEAGAFVKDCVLMQGAVIKKGCELHNIIADKRTVFSEETKLIAPNNNPICIKKGSVL